jgi:HTH-type transcriptional regulator, competence development regulator
MAVPEDRRHMVGERLADLREQKALTLRDLEEASGVGADAISKIENGHRKPRPSTLRKLARALGIEVEEFFREPAVPLGEASREAGQWLLEMAQDAARYDEEKDSEAIARLFASEGTPQTTHGYEEDEVRAELRERGFPDKYFEGFIWPLVSMVNQQRREISRLREENSRLREEAEQESVHR